MNLHEILHTLVFGFPVTAELIDHSYPVWLQSTGGLVLTLIITGISLVCGLMIGLLLAAVRSTETRGKEIISLRPMWIAGMLIKYVSIAFTEVLRGLPIMIIVLLVYYLPFALFRLRAPGVLLAIFAFSMYAGVYLSDIFQSGFRAVGQSRLGVARVMGLSKLQILTHIKIPIAFHTMIPAILGIAVTVLKDSSVLMVVAVPELTFTSRQIQISDPRLYAATLLMVLMLYWLIALAGSIGVHYLERRWERRAAV